MKTALITGVTGQDGSYLAEFLLSKGYRVLGMVRRSSTFNTSRIDHLLQDLHEKGVRLFRNYGDLADTHSLYRLIFGIYPVDEPPDEIYHLGAQSHVRVSFDIPEYTSNITALGTLRLLEIIRDFEQRHPNKKIKFYQAGSSEMFGITPSPQNENSSFQPQSPYGCAKVFAHHMARIYRDAYGLFACNGILFNHESPRRGPTFVSKKIVKGVCDIVRGKMQKFYLGNLDAERDWGYAPEYVEAMWLMLQQPHAGDYVIATGESHSVREFVTRAFSCVGVETAWEGTGIEEKGIDRKSGKILVEIDPIYFRPTEVYDLRGDATKAQDILGWRAKTTFDDLVQLMLEEEMNV